MANNILICESHVKAYILARAKTLRPGWPCRRVSKQALNEINARVRVMVDKMIKSHPTLGKTFMV